MSCLLDFSNRSFMKFPSVGSQVLHNPIASMHDIFTIAYLRTFGWFFGINVGLDIYLLYIDPMRSDVQSLNLPWNVNSAAIWSFTKKSLLFDATVFAPGSQTARQIWDKFAAGWIWMKLGMTMKSKWYIFSCVWTIGGCWNVSSLDSFSILIIISIFLCWQDISKGISWYFNKPTILLPPPKV